MERAYDWDKFFHQAHEGGWWAGDEIRKINSDYRCWLAQWFGKDWIFYLWMAFSKVDENMMKCVNDICRKRAALSEDADKDPASSRVDVMKLSERNQYIELGLTPVPPIRGIQHRRSIPLIARLDARKRETEYHAWVKEVEASGYWSDENRDWYTSEWQEIEQDWKHAVTISMGSGNEFYDRDRVLQNQGQKPNMVTEIIDLYWREYGHLGHFRRLRAREDQRPAQPNKRDWNQRGGWHQSNRKSRR
jgi:hypothetical protein